MVYFSLSFRWFGETAGSEVGWFAPGLVLGPALLSAWTFAVAAVGVWWARRYAPPALMPFASALAFAIMEGVRSLGTLANPFAAIAYPQVTTIFGQLAAYVGAGGVTFAVIFAGACICQMLTKPDKLKPPVIGLGTLLVVLIAATVLAPARVVPQATTPVAIIQGNIRQQLKWIPGALEQATDRYVALTRNVGTDAPGDIAHPRFILWPETVIPTDLASSPALQEQFRQLAASLGTTLIVGALERRGAVPYDTLWFIDRTGVERIYRKRKLVPFAEMLPAANILGRLPITNLVSRFGEGKEATVVPIGERHVAPLICWESEFPDLIEAQVHRGADVLVLSTDDAWFGESDGPYQHAQIAQMRAIESGRWIVRAAATGISGIIAPNGQFTERTVLNTMTILRGHVGNAVDTPFNHIGALNVLLAMIAGYAAIVGSSAWRRRSEHKG
jgi:apolipoprotein N-acyltransferase